MNIKYLDCGDKKLISYHIHDCKTHENEAGFWMIDGGQMGYVRVSAPEGNIVKTAPLEELLPFIREDFTWIKTTDVKGNRLKESVSVLLKDLEASHIYNIIDYLRPRSLQIIGGDVDFTIALLNKELEFRANQKKKNNSISFDMYHQPAKPF